MRPHPEPVCASQAVFQGLLSIWGGRVAVREFVLHSARDRRGHMQSVLTADLPAFSFITERGWRA
eukprot:350949-Chlamydomonas_euryale.AAC.1